MEQLDLFPQAEIQVITQDRERLRLTDYWRERLRRWPSDVLFWRHHRDTTGWSMATQGFCFARFLFRDGLMSKVEFRRWFSLHRRVRRLDQVE